MNNLIAELKEKEEHGSPILRALSGTMLWLRYDDESQGVVATNQEGALLTHDEYQDLVEGLNRFFAFYEPETIKAFNTERAQRQSLIAQGWEKPKRSPVAGHVYLIRAENGLYKIGKAKNITARLKPFGVDFPMKWDLVYSFSSGDYSLAEEALHRRFADKRGIGEWFQLLPEDVAYIMSIQDGQL